LNCHEAHPLLHGYVDGELDLTAALALEQHLEDCTACAQAQAELLAVRTALQGGALYFQPPPDLRNRVQSAVRQAARPPRVVRPFRWRWLAVAAALAFVILTGYVAAALVARRGNDVLEQQVVASHIRSLQQPNHIIDVKSSNQHEVKPWFEGKIDFAPPVYDLDAHDFELVGGRLDYLNERPVAAIVYRRRLHHINLYVWPSSSGPSAPVATTRHNYHLIHWTEGGVTFWAISDLNENELQDFVRLIQERAR